MHEIPLPHGIMTRFPAVGVNKNALILCPGGGYEHCSIREGAPAAAPSRKAASRPLCCGMTVLRRRSGPVRSPRCRAAVQWVRAHAEQYGISPQRIAVGGFSAGAHLAGLHAAVWNRASWYPQGTDLALHQPNAAVLCYPVVSAGKYAHRGSFEQLAGDDMEKQQAFSLETLVSPDMPRTFLWHTLTDETVPVENSLLLEKSLRRAAFRTRCTCFRTVCTVSRLRIWRRRTSKRGVCPTAISPGGRRSARNG